MLTQAIETRARARRLEKTPLSPGGVFFLALPVARMSGATAGNICPNIASLTGLRRCSCGCSQLPRLLEPHDHARERHAQHLDCALGDHHTALIPEEALDRQLLRESHPPMDLHAAVSGPE